MVQGEEMERADVMKECGRRIQMARKAMELNQEQLARQIGVTARTLSAWEGGTSSPQVAELTAIAEVLHVPVEMLLPSDANDMLAPLKAILVKMPATRQRELVQAWRTIACFPYDHDGVQSS